MPTHDGLRTTTERKLSEQERATVEAFLALLDAAEVQRLEHLVPLVVNDSAWWFRDELTKLAAKKRLDAAGKAQPKKK